MPCSRCNTINSDSARFCKECGLDLSQANTERQPSVGPRPSAPISLSPIAPEFQAQLLNVTYPYSRLAGHSVLQKLAVARPPLATFWVGLLLIFFSVVCSVVTVAFGMLGATNPELNDPAAFRTGTVATGVCLLLVLLLLGTALLIAGRPRRR